MKKTVRRCLRGRGRDQEGVQKDRQGRERIPVVRDLGILPCRYYTLTVLIILGLWAKQLIQVTIYLIQVTICIKN